MPTIRERAGTLLRERLGLEVLPAAQVQWMRESLTDYEYFREEAEDLGWFALDYMSGRPQEMRADTRRRLAQKSRYALIHDPHLRAEGQHLANFSFGRGVGVPDAKDDAVQAILDEAWSDPVNAEVLTSYEAQRKLSNDLLTSANLYPVAYIAAGHVRAGLIGPDRVERIVTDPENDNRALWYLAREMRIDWDYAADRPSVFTDAQKDGIPKLIYWPHWRNVEAAKQEGMSFEGLTPDKVGDGLVYHVRINRVGETQFGTPPWAASLRFASAMNDFLESRVIMAQAASQFVAKRVRKDTPEGLLKAARSVTNIAGELARTRAATTHTEVPDPRWPNDPRNRLGPGAWWMETPTDTLESLRLDSGAAGASQDAQIIRSPLAAASTFGQHWLGDASNANLATATTLELPALMTVGAWQETFEQMYRWFADLVIQEAVKAGRLGGAVSLSDNGIPLEELYLREADGKAEMESRTGKDLGYSFQMPYPGRRNLPDVTTTYQSMITTVPGFERNEEALTEALTFLFTHGWELEDPAGTAEKIVEAQKKIWDEADAQAAAIAAGGGGPAPPQDGNQGGGGETVPADQRSQYGEQRRSSPPGREMGRNPGAASAQEADEPYLDPGLARVAADLETDVRDLFTAVPELALAGQNGDAAA